MAIKAKIKKLFANKKRVRIIFIIFLVLTLIYLFIDKVVNPLIIDSSYSKVKSLSQDAVNTAVFEVIKDSKIYDSLINIIRNESGDIVMISTNAIQINSLAREIVENAQKKLRVLGEKGVNIPIGTFTGMPIFVGQGPSINIKLLPIGAINCTFSSSFVSAGINQTSHKIYIEISSSVNMILPTATRSVSTKTQLLIAENIIIGKIPETYLQSDSIDEMLNLVPNWFLV